MVRFCINFVQAEHVQRVNHDLSDPGYRQKCLAAICFSCIELNGVHDVRQSVRLERKYVQSTELVLIRFNNQIEARY